MSCFHSLKKKIATYVSFAKDFFNMMENTLYAWQMLCCPPVYFFLASLKAGKVIIFSLIRFLLKNN